MTKPDVATDRRDSPRIEARLQIELAIDTEGSSETANTINISSNGVYFTCSRYIEPLTKLGMRLLLGSEAADDKVESIDVQGVVVRVEPDSAEADVDQWDIACYFTDSTPEFRERLGRYVQAEF
jgi:hypothetical protein